MRNALLASTAVVAAGLAGAAWASEPVSVTVGGYMYAGVGYEDVDNSNITGDVGVMRDGEIHFDIRGTSDNGLTFRADVELEAFTSGDQIDENWVSVGGSFGTVKIGGDDHASYNQATGIVFSQGAKIGHYDAFGESIPTGGYLSNNRFSDTLGIFYITPNIAGFVGEVSYHPGAGVDGANDTNSLSGGNADVVSIGLNYATSFSGFDLRLSGGYDIVNGGLPAGADDDGFSVGAQVGYAGFTFGGHYAEGVGLTGENEYVLNAIYNTGPWDFGLGGGYGENVAGLTGDLYTIAGWVGYDISAGVKANFGVEYTDGPQRIGDGVTAMGWLGLSF